MFIANVAQSLSPGNEQREYWGSAAADEPSSRNYAGIKDPVVDELIELVIAAPSRESLIQRTRALDRVLLWGHYVIPQLMAPFDRILYWDKFGRPGQIGRASCRERVWQSVYISVVAVALKNKHTKLNKTENQQTK